MATNPNSYYGRTIACIDDADELWSEIEGPAVVVQDAIHRLTCDSVLGPGGEDWGFDLRKKLGAPQQELTRSQPFITEVLTRDDRVDTADVTLTATSTNGMADIRIDAILHTALGTFPLTRLLSEITDTQIGALGS